MEENRDIRSVINIVLASSLFGIWLLWLWSRRNLYRFALKMPGSFGFPIIGSYTIVRDIKLALDNIGVIKERCKSKTICAWLGLYPSMFTSDPKVIEQVLSSPELINKAKTSYAPLDALIGRGLVTSPTTIWQHKRKMINPSFHHKVIRNLLPVFHKGKQSLLIKLDKMAENGEHLLAEEIQRTVLGITIAILQVLSVLFERTKSNTICAWMGFYPIMFTSDPEFIAKILASSELLNKAKTFYSPVFDAFGGGIISSPATGWQHNRKMINPSFHHKVLVSFLPVFHKGKNCLLSKLDKMVDNREHLLLDIIQRTTLGIAVETTMGKIMKPGDQIEEDFTSNFRFLMEKIIIHIMLTCVKLGKLFPLYFKFEKVKNNAKKFVYKLVEEKLNKMHDVTMKSIEAPEIDSIKKSPNIFIDQAIEIYQKQKFSLNDVIVESNNIVAAAFETTANSIFSALLMMATHPEIQERVFEEIVNIFPEKDFQMEYEHLGQLPYLDMVINETLRLAPAIPIIGRHILDDLQLTKGLILPKGLQVLISIYHVHRRKDIWGPNADKFNPDNFLPENITSKHSYSFIPFSKGIRNCIGWRYALFAMKAMLAGIVRNYRLTTTTKYEDIQFTFHVALKYLNEPSFKIYRRD